MTHINTSGSGRRVLIFPAVHPPESTSPRGLLSSLIGLGNAICSYKSKPFFSNRRHALQTLRHVSNILLFLQEIDTSNVPESALFGLSELHLAFQKTRYLLEDLTRAGSRLWMLMKLDRVANHFRVLTRSMAVALDVLPLGSIGAPEEAKEIAEFFIRQSRKTWFDVDSRDRKVVRDVGSILSGFEVGSVPVRDDLVRVLDYIGVRSWTECDGEVRSLDSEIGFEALRDQKRVKEITLLSSLIGFMSYCRCVCFDLVDHEEYRPSDRRSNTSMASNVFSKINGDDLLCPISLQIMADPVVTTTGHTYDRASINKWFRSGNPTCPKTSKRLTSQDLIPNLAIRRLVEQYCSENGISIPQSDGRRNPHSSKRCVPSMSRAAEGAIKLTALYLEGRMRHGTVSEMNKSAYEIRILTKSSVFNRSCLAEAGTIPHLLSLLYSQDSAAQENAIAALLSLSKHPDSRAIIVNNGELDAIVSVLKQGVRLESKQHAAAVLFYLSSVEEYRKMIGQNPDAVPNLVAMVRDGTHRGKRNALVAIFGLSVDKTNHNTVLSAGSVRLLVDILKSSDREYLWVDSLAVLSNLAESREGALAILKAGAINTIIEILKVSSSRIGKEYCVALLLSLCINGGRETVIADVARSSSLMESLYALLSEGSSRAGKKASSLIRLLQEYYDEESTRGPTAPILRREQFVGAW